MQKKPAIDSDGRIVGTRTTVWDVFPFLEQGDSIEFITESLPLTSEQVQAVVEYVDANRDSVSEIHREIEERIRRGNPAEIQRKAELARIRMERSRQERHAS